MDWGTMGGLGAGLSELGRQFDAKAKANLAEKLEREREARAEERKIAAEERQVKRDLAKVDPTQSRMLERGGKLYVQHRNSLGDLLREEEATPDQIAERDYTNKTRDIDLRAKGLAAQLTEKKFNDYDADRQLERAKTQSEIEENRAQAAYAADERRFNRSQSSPESAVTTPVDNSKVARQLVTDYKDLVEGYADRGLTAEDAHNVAQIAVKTATREGRDFGDAFRRALRDYVNSKYPATE